MVIFFHLEQRRNEMSVNQKRSLKMFTVLLVLPSLTILLVFWLVFQSDGETASDVFDSIKDGMSESQVGARVYASSIRNDVGSFYVPDRSSSHYGYPIYGTSKFLPPAWVWITVDDDRHVIGKELIKPTISDVFAYWAHQAKERLIR